MRRCIADWQKGDNKILELSKAYKLQPGTGWLIDPCILHAPGSLWTYGPQWGSDVFGMYQNLAKDGVVFENTSATEPLVALRYFGPEVNPDAPAVGAHKRG